MSRPGGFKLLSCLSETQRRFIKQNVSDVEGKEHFTYVAEANVADGSKEKAVYVDVDGEKGRMHVHPTKNTSWYHRTLVFIQQKTENEKDKDLHFKTYTPMIERNLTMTSDESNDIVVFQQKPRKDGEVITSTFLVIGESYEWKTLKPNAFLSLDTDTGKIKFGKRGSQFKFFEPPKVGIPDGFKPYIEVKEEIKITIANNIPIYSNMKLSLHATRINVRNNEDGDQRLYVELQLEKANLKATTPNTRVDFNGMPWNQYYFVFAKKDEVSFEVFTPMAKHNFGLAIVGKTHSFSSSPPYGWTVFQFIAADDNYWYWKVEGENLYMYCDPVTGDITATDDLSKRSQFSFLYDEEEEDQSDRKPPEHEVCKQEASEQEADDQEAGRRWKIRKVQ